MGPGAINRWKGTIKGLKWEDLSGATGEWTFIGDEEDPLTFGSVYGSGYTYLHGKGKVIFPDGKEVKLGY